MAGVCQMTHRTFYSQERSHEWALSDENSQNELTDGQQTGIDTTI